VLLCCESVGGAQRQRRTDTHRDRETERTGRHSETERELADFVDWSLDNSILTIVANCIPRRKSLVGGFRSCFSFFLSFFWVFSVSGCSCCTCQLSDRCGFFLLQVSDRFLSSFLLLDFKINFFFSSSSSSLRQE
jgi:hypothetical protein